MLRETRGKAVASLLGLLWTAALFAGTDPTPAQIVTGWQALAGSKFGKVVYWLLERTRSGRRTAHASFSIAPMGTADKTGRCTRS